MNILSIFIGFEAKYAKFSLTLRALVHVAKVLLYDIMYLSSLPFSQSIIMLWGDAVRVLTRGSPTEDTLNVCLAVGVVNCKWMRDKGLSLTSEAARKARFRLLNQSKLSFLASEVNSFCRHF